MRTVPVCGPSLISSTPLRRYHQTKLANAVFTSALQDRLDASGSKIIVSVAVPGLAASNLQATAAQNGSSFGMAALMKLAQSEEDGALPLIHCVAAEAVPKAALMMPAHRGVMGIMMREGTYGPAKLCTLEPVCTDQASKALLWSASEAAVGAFAV